MRYQLINILDQAVQREVFATDNPLHVGVNVSGGLDSSTVCALAKRWNPMPDTFTGYYNEPGFDERRYARMAAAGTVHHEIKITPQDFVDNFDAMMRHFTPPFQGPGMFGQYMVAKYIREHTDIKVVLSGEGSDELFGGYARLMKVAGTQMPDGYQGYVPPPDYPKTIREALDYDYERLPDLLKVDDEALGAFELKAGAPFTDERVVRYALALPPTMRINKDHLRRAVRGLVPDPIIDRTDKKGFPVPFVQWANECGNPVRDFVGDRLGYLPNAAKPFDRGWWNDLLAPYNEPAQIAA
jgi:asparagine synthetase B (glutamine-hydrolysing)